MPIKPSESEELIDQISKLPRMKICFSHRSKVSVEIAEFILKRESNIGLNREKLAHCIYCIKIGVNVNPQRWEEIGGEYKDQYYKFADAIIAKESELLEVK